MNVDDLTNRRNKVYQEIKDYLDACIPPSQKTKFNEIAQNKCLEDYNELKELKAYINSKEVDFQIFHQKLNRYKELSKKIIRQVAVYLYGHPR